MQENYVADRERPEYEENLTALRRVSILWKYEIHGDDSRGWVDIEFKDLVTAAAFVQILPEGVANLAALRPVAFFRNVAVVVTFPVPDDRPLFG